MTHENDNSAIVQDRFPRLFSSLPSAASETAVRCIFSQNEGGHMAGVVEKDGQEYQFVSKYDPEKHARLFVEKNYLAAADAFIVLGLELGFTARALLRAMTREQKLVLIEPDQAFFQEQLKACDLRDIFSDVRLTLVVDHDVARVMDTIKTCFWNFKMDNVAFIVTPVYKDIFPEYVLMMRKNFLAERESRLKQKTEFKHECANIRAQYFNEHGQMGNLKAFLQKIQEHALKEQSTMIEQAYLFTGMLLAYKAYTETAGA